MNDISVLHTAQFIIIDLLFVSRYVLLHSVYITRSQKCFEGNISEIASDTFHRFVLFSFFEKLLWIKSLSQSSYLVQLRERDVQSDTRRRLAVGDSADGIPVEERDRLQRELKEQEKLLEGYQRVGSFISLPVLRLTHQEGIFCCEYVFCEVHVYRLSNTSTSICIDVTPLSA